MAALEQGSASTSCAPALNDNEQAAARFLGWVNFRSRHRPVSNVTVFDGASTLFRFPCSQCRWAKISLPKRSRRSIRPAQSLKIEMVLNRGRAAEELAGQQSGAVRASASQDLMPRDHPGGHRRDRDRQAMIYRTLGNIAAEDLMRAVEAEVLKANGDWSKSQGRREIVA